MHVSLHSIPANNHMAYDLHEAITLLTGKMFRGSFIKTVSLCVPNTMRPRLFEARCITKETACPDLSNLTQATMIVRGIKALGVLGVCI